MISSLTDEQPQTTTFTGKDQLHHNNTESLLKGKITLCCGTEFIVVIVKTYAIIKENNEKIIINQNVWIGYL